MVIPPKYDNCWSFENGYAVVSINYKEGVIDKNGNYVPINVPFKSSNENYYESGKSYNFINTCNNWTNQGIKLMGIKTATWAPFDRCILYHF